MKYAVIAALLATSTQALTGCKEGIGAKVYSDSKCKEKATSEHTLLQKDVEKTGKCDPHSASKTDKDSLKFAEETLVDKEATAKTALKKFQRYNGIAVQKGGVDVSPEDKYSGYPAVKTAYVKKVESKKVVDKWVKENETAGTTVLRTEVDNYMVAYKLYLEEKADSSATETTIQAKLDATTPL